MATLCATPPSPANPWWRPWAVPAALALGAFATFALALRAGLVWDDLAFLPPAGKLVAPAFGDFFRHDVWYFARPELATNTPIYRPTTAIVMWLGGLLFGGATAPWHALILALHAGNSVLVYALARRVAPKAHWLAAAAGAGWFAVNPGHAEAVAWILAFAHPVATLFSLVAIHAQLTHARRGGRRWLVLALACAAAAALASEGALGVPVLLVAIEWIERRERPGAAVWLSCAVTAAIPLVLRKLALQAPVPIALTPDALRRSASFAAAYLRELVTPWPSPPHGSYPRAGVAGPGTWLAALGVIGVLAVALARVPALARRRALLAVAWIALTVAPPVAAAMNPSPFFAPRSLYLPSAGLALLASLLLSQLVDLASPRLRVLLPLLGVCGIVLGNLAALEWRDEETVRRRMIVADPEAVAPRLALARILSGSGRAAEALNLLLEANRFAVRRIDRLEAREALAVHYGMEGRLVEAEGLLREVLAEDATRATAWNGAGNVALLRNDLLTARTCYERALSLLPRYGEAAFNLSLALQGLGDAQGASRARQRALENGVGR